MACGRQKTYYTGDVRASVDFTFSTSAVIDSTIEFVTTRGKAKTYIAKPNSVVFDGSAAPGGEICFQCGSGVSSTAPVMASSAAEHLVAAINHDNGHNEGCENEWLRIALNGSSITLTQDEGGDEGNTDIAVAGDFNASIVGTVPASFLGGIKGSMERSGGTTAQQIREYGFVSVSGVGPSNLNNGGAFLPDVSSLAGYDEDSQYLIWGVIAGTSSGAGSPIIGTLYHTATTHTTGQMDSAVIATITASKNGPFFVNYDQPIEIPKGAGISWDPTTAVGSGEILFIYYTIKK
jgi:hypothetical protein